MPQAVCINDIIRSFGIDTHIDHTDGNYSNAGDVVKALDDLGLDTAPDHAPNSASDPNGQTRLGDVGVDKIQDFSSAAGDKLLLDHAIFVELSLSGFSDANFVVGTKALQADDRLIYDRASGILAFDADGSAAGTAIHVADLDNSPALHFKDIVLI